MRLPGVRPYLRCMNSPRRTERPDSSNISVANRRDRTRIMHSDASLKQSSRRKLPIKAEPARTRARRCLGGRLSRYVSGSADAQGRPAHRRHRLPPKSVRPPEQVAGIYVGLRGNALMWLTMPADLHIATALKNAMAQPMTFNAAASGSFTTARRRPANAQLWLTERAYAKRTNEAETGNLGSICCIQGGSMFLTRHELAKYLISFKWKGRRAV